MCNDCVEAATEMSPRPGPLAEPVGVDEPAVADAQAEMHLGPDVLVEKDLVAPADEEADGPDVPEPEEAEVGEFVVEPDEVPPADEEPPVVGLGLTGDDAGLDEDEAPAVDEDEAMVADSELDEDDMPGLAEVLGGLGDDELAASGDDGAGTVGAGLLEDEPWLRAEDEPVMTDAGLVEDEPPAPQGDEPVLTDAGFDEYEPPALATATPAFADVRTDDDALVRRIEALEDRLAGAGQPEPLGLSALEETIQRLDERADAQAGLHLAMQAQMDELHAAVAAAQDKQGNDELRRQVDHLGERLAQLQGTIDAEWARTKAETATLAQTITDLGERVLRLAEQAGDSAGVEDERVAALEEKVDEVVARLESALESQRRELQDSLQEGLAEVLSARPQAPAAALDDPSRLGALERQVQQSRDEVADLNELHAALDAGLGSLRAELGELRTTFARLADSKADLDDRLETFVRMSLVPEGDKGRKARKAAESNLGTLSAAVQDLLREQRQLKETVAGLERASDGATAAAARASSQASSLGPLRSEMKLLHQELVEQQETLDGLRQAVDRLRQPPAATPPPATRSAATKAAPAKRPAAKATVAQAATRGTAAKKATPVAKKAPRAKKA